MKSRIVLPEKFYKNDTILLKDLAWAFLFPREWIQYRLKHPEKNAAKLKVIDVGLDSYTVEIMEIALEDGKLIMPIGMRTETSLKQIHIALIATFKKD